MNEINTVFALLIIFQLKHFLSDFPLQGKYMLGKFNSDWSFFKPLAAHCLVHGIFTFSICIYFVNTTDAILLALMDTVLHFTMDRVKAGPKYLGRYNDKTSYKFWWALGFDQMFHHLTHYIIIYFLISR